MQRIPHQRSGLTHRGHDRTSRWGESDAMPFFVDADELYEYVGGIWRAAAEHPEVGAPLTGPGITIQLYFSEPEASLTVSLRDPVRVTDGGDDASADIVVRMPGDIADRYWRGEYNLGIGLARGKILSEGPVDKLLELVPLTRPMFPAYRQSVAAKDSATAISRT